MSVVMILRLAMSVAVFGLWTYFSAISNAMHTLVSGNLAGQQFENSDTTAINVGTSLSFLDVIVSLPTLGALVVLLIIWWLPLGRLTKL